MLETGRGIIWMLVTLSGCIMCLTSSAPATTDVIVSSERVSCLAPGKSAWSLTCVVIIPDHTYVMAVNVKALDRFNVHSIIASCSIRVYTDSSFSQSMGQSGRACRLPKQNVKNEFNVTFWFANVVLNSDGRLSFPVRNISCGAVVYPSNKSYVSYMENSTQDLLQCASPTIELPPAFLFVSGSVAVVTCSALCGYPEAHVLLTVTPATNLSSISVTGMINVSIAINASSQYHKATVNCTVLNHAHYLAPKTSEILVHYLSRRESLLQSPLIDTTIGGVVDCSEMVESYPDAKYEWLMDEEVIWRESIYKVSTLSTGKLQCFAMNPAANATVSITYTLYYELYVVILPVLGTLLIVLIAVSVWRACRRNPKFCQKRRAPLKRRQRMNEAAGENGGIKLGLLSSRKTDDSTEFIPTDASEEPRIKESGTRTSQSKAERPNGIAAEAANEHGSSESVSLNLQNTVELTEGVPAREVDDDSVVAVSSQVAPMTDENPC